MALPKEKRQTGEQVAAFAKKAAQQNEFHRSRRNPTQKFRRDPYQKLMGMAFASRWQVVIGRHSMTNSPVGKPPDRLRSGINPVSHPFGSTASLPLSMRRRELDRPSSPRGGPIPWPEYPAAG